MLDDRQLPLKLADIAEGFDQDFASYGEYIARSGDTWSPAIRNDEPLRLECIHFIERNR